MRPRHLLHLIAAAFLLVGSLLPGGSAVAAAPGSQPDTRHPYQIRSVPNPEAFARPDLKPSLFQERTAQVLLKLKQEPVVAVYARAQQQGRTLSATEQNEYRTQLEKAQNTVLQRVTAAGGKLIYRFQNALNGVFVEVPVTELPELAALPQVEAIYPARPVELHNESSVPFMGADQVWEMVADGLNVTGEGIRVAVIDTGIDYYHAALGGSGSVDDYLNDDPTVVEPGTFPTAKVVGGWDLAGDDYDASHPDRDIPKPDPDPLDFGGHGTHVAATIGGVGSAEVGPGVAPDVLLYAFKVFGTEGSTSLSDAAIEMAMDPNQDGDVRDHVDVINMSLGSPFGAEVWSEMAQRAAELGILVVASAGNSGDAPYITGAPAVAPDAISVAASADDGIMHGAIEVNSPEAIAGIYEAAEAAITPLLADYGDVTADVVYAGYEDDEGNYVGYEGCSTDDFVADFTEKIALIDRGSCNFSVKILNAQNAGAAAVVVVNSADGDPITMGGSPKGIEIPAVMIRMDDGQRIKDALDAGETANVTLSADFAFPRPDLTDTLADFSSRGPGGPNNSFKPDLAAPGLDIFSAATGTGTGGVLMSGTSMAAPHTAGAAALMRQLHPDWSVQEIKALLQNTASPTADLAGNVYPITRQGTGRIDLAKAAEATVLAMPGGISFGYVATSETNSVTRTVTVVNKSDQDRTFDLAVEFTGDSTGVTPILSPSSVTVPANGQTTFDLTLQFDPSGLPSQWDENGPWAERSGWIHLTETPEGGEELVVGFIAVPEVTAAVTGSPQEAGSTVIELSNPAILDGWVSPFHLLKVDARDPHMEGAEWADLRYVGVRYSQVPYSLEDGTIVWEDQIQFALVTHAPWGASESVNKEIYLDVNMDGADDYALFTAALTADLMATWVFDLNDPDAVAYPVAINPPWPVYNASAAILAAPLTEVGLQPGQSFNYAVVTYPGDPALTDSIPNGVVDGSLTSTPWDFEIVPAGGTSVLDWSSEGGDLLLIYEDNPRDRQAQAFTFPAAAVPANPTGLDAINDDGAVQLVWDRSTDGTVMDYLVYRRLAESEDEPELVQVVPQPSAGNQVYATDTGLANEVEYQYQVFSRNHNSVLSEEAATATAHPSAAPAMPANLRGRASRDGVTLSWKANTEPDLEGYVVFTLDLDTETWTSRISLPAEATSWTDDEPNTSVAHTYGLVAFDEHEVESAMAQVNVRAYRPPSSGGGGGGGGAPAPAPPTPPAPPKPPAGPPTGLRATAGDGSITLSWKAVEGATQYKISWGAGSTQPALWQELATVSGTEYTWNDVTNGVTYWFRVEAMNEHGSSAASQPVWALPQAETVAPATYENSHEAVKYTGTWATLPAAGEGNNQAMSNSAMATATLTFQGAGITWVAEAGPDRGIALVYLDGVPTAVVDLYQPEATPNHVAYENKDLAPGAHTFTVVITGLKGAEAQAAYVSLDRIVVHPEQAEPESQEADAADGSGGTGASDEADSGENDGEGGTEGEN